jgi:putative inorganic carbon (HCO3(-)) transporter
MNHGDTVPTFLSSSGLPARRSESKGGTRACLPALRRRLRQGEPARQGSRKILYLLLLALELLLLYLTYSYGTWISIIVASLLTVILNFFCHPERAQRAEGSLSIKRLLLIIIFGALALSQYNNPKLQHIVNSDYYSSLHSRIMIWQSALLVSRDHWLTGVGAGNFQQAYLDYQSRFPEPYIEWAVPQPHNIFLAFLTQLGIIGLISFILIVLLTLFIVIPAKAGIQKSNFKLRITDPLTLWATAYLVYLIVHGLVDTPYFKNDLAILFWLALAIIWSLNTTRTIDCGSQQK